MDVKEQKLLSRKRVVLDVPFEKATLPYAEVRKKVAAEVKASEDVVAVQHVYGAFGKRQAKVIANVYESKEALAKFEPKPKVKDDKKPVEGGEKK
jgi:ribosomal protein S24E